jgi:hypothetical protein
MSDPTGRTADALAALNTAGKRVKVHDAQMVIKLPESVKALVKEQATANEVSEATIVRWALADYFAKRGYSNR